jgi:hypothetical protein
MFINRQGVISQNTDQSVYAEPEILYRLNDRTHEYGVFFYKCFRKSQITTREEGWVMRSMGVGGTVPLILIFGNMEQRSSLRPDRFIPHPGKTAPRYSLSKKLIQSWSRLFGEEKTYCSGRTELRLLHCRAISLTAISRLAQFLPGRPE